MEAYRDAIALIVADSFDLSSYSPSLEEIAQRAETWTRYLFGRVPELRLPDAFDLAFDLQENGRAINAYNIKDAWRIIERRELEEEKKRQAEEMALRINAALNCPERDNHLPGFDEALQEYGVGGRFVKLPCQRCRNEAHKRRGNEALAEIDAERDNLKFLQEAIDAANLIIKGGGFHYLFLCVSTIAELPTLRLVKLPENNTLNGGTNERKVN